MCVCVRTSLGVYASEHTYAYSYSKRERYLHEFEYSREMTRLRYGDGLRIATSNNPFVTFLSAKGICFAATSQVWVELFKPVTHNNTRQR